MGDVDIGSIVKWKMMEVVTAQINRVLGKHKARLVQAWQQLNREIVEGQFAFDVNREMVTVPYKNRTIEVNTKGWGYGVIEYYEQQVFENDRPAHIDEYGRVSEIS
ncbi:hypothetical protein FHQ26_01750 [Testudinibacter sp. TR-2022]|uniref:hypothetical protein n=1 Tax=Testudinibacter sp. TR-2022 TaxID=2585029 RepID=UPI001119E7E2|nr:hypothetical protein [Testudinibacter sp. TR-2022]TNH02668.1 hypothetical protein FHQ22_09565 [Pasteurellaceae bacterium Phil31]TNH10091.1 hypothetical protein FHQ25_06190 [Testudinibacter sp. TR-2022]TNH12475.1 hypothetical protein FHQ26_01750 [Testudinibacter sp. TR-2022]